MLEFRLIYLKAISYNIKDTTVTCIIVACLAYTYRVKKFKHFVVKFILSTYMNESS